MAVPPNGMTTGGGEINEPCDDAEDDVRWGGPITSGMIHTAILGCAKGHLRADDLIGYREWVHGSIDMERLAQHINSWLTRVE